MQNNIQVGNYSLRVEQDYDINKHCAIVCLRDANKERGKPSKACYFEIPVDPDHDLAINTDEWYAKQALSMLEAAGGFGVVAVDRMPGELTFNATLKASYVQGWNDCKAAILKAIDG